MSRRNAGAAGSGEPEVPPPRPLNVKAHTESTSEPFSTNHRSPSNSRFQCSTYLSVQHQIQEGDAHAHLPSQLLSDSKHQRPCPDGSGSGAPPQESPLPPLLRTKPWLLICFLVTSPSSHLPCYSGTSRDLLLQGSLGSNRFCWTRPGVELRVHIQSTFWECCLL